MKTDKKTKWLFAGRNYAERQILHYGDNELKFVLLLLRWIFQVTSSDGNDFLSERLVWFPGWKFLKVFDNGEWYVIYQKNILPLTTSFG